MFGEPVHFSSLATYSIGFFCFWAICAASSMATCYLLRTAQEFKGADQET
nr:K342 [uncultured bacterium]